MAEQYDVALLGKLPLDTSIRKGVDEGKPTVAIFPDSPITESYRAIARKSAAILAKKSRDYSGKFPKIVVENS